MISNNKVKKIVQGETVEGISFILIYQYGRVEFVCHLCNIQKWIQDESIGEMIESNASILTIEEIKEIIRGR